MKTSDIKVGSSYIHNECIVTVVQRIPGKPKKRVSIWDEPSRTEKSFLLDNGNIVKAKQLNKLL